MKLHNLTGQLCLLPRKLLMGLLSLYSNHISLLFLPRCRFYPSCSRYSHDAICTHGVVRGLYLTVRRLLKCHPWHEGGFDPVPDRSSPQHRCKHNEAS